MDKFPDFMLYYDPFVDSLVIKYKNKKSLIIDGASGLMGGMEMPIDISIEEKFAIRCWMEGWRARQSVIHVEAGRKLSQKK